MAVVLYQSAVSLPLLTLYPYSKPYINGFNSTYSIDLRDITIRIMHYKQSEKDALYRISAYYSCLAST